ncbi:MAG TPA: LysM peptidoglycan-binding domain-containing protein [Longimicrobiales bacterium]|nr:LysM peptidoglycan-binding domain-containing protein [Longimicrobiales bacterium]
MELPRYGRPALVGIAVAALAAAGGRTVWQGSPPTEPAPMEAILDEGLADAEAVMWDLPAERNERVEFWIDFLSDRNKEKTQLWLERIGRYGPFIQEQLRARGMPADLLYFAMIESGFSNKAYSRAAAVGMWQFIAETGRRYGLEVSSYVDERRDPVEATRAALDYLQYMHDDFGSWYLAAAGYNSGENRVRRILREQLDGARGDEELYWKISEYLPRETRDYVPLMLAAAYIAKEPAKYGFTDLNYQDPLLFESVEVEGGTSLEVVARAAGVDDEAVRDLNLHLVRGITPPGRSWAVRLPTGTRETFAANFGKVAEEVRLAGVVHRVGRGETLSHIASRYGTSVSALEGANRGLDPRRLQLGQEIVVPDAGATLASASSAGASASDWSTYRVRPGDSLWTIARRHGVSVGELQSWNDLGRRTRIRPGQSLRLRG